MKTRESFGAGVDVIFKSLLEDLTASVVDVVKNCSFWKSEMNLDVYIESLRNTRGNIKSTLEEWNDIPKELTHHYLDEIVMLISRIPEAMVQATVSLNSDLFTEVNLLLKEFQSLKYELLCVGIDFKEILNISITGDRQSTTDREELEHLRSITRCKYFYLNPRYPQEENRPTYLPCSQVINHKGRCK